MELSGRTIKVWVEAMRLRTLPVSVAGVIAAIGYARHAEVTNAAVCALCLAVAVLAQIASNFANEYFDYRDGLDRPGREGPRRGVTEGDITPRSMLAATIATLGAACCAGLCLLFYGPWWLVAVGVAVAAGVIAYSAGPYPLSRHCLGEVAVVVFFGLVPVNFTYYIQAHAFSAIVAAGSFAIGLMGANVLVVNNYRDRADDLAVGKHTLATLFGARAMICLYAFNGLCASMLLMYSTQGFGIVAWIGIGLYLLAVAALTVAMSRLRGHQLNPILGMTAMSMLVTSLFLL